MIAQNDDAFGQWSMHFSASPWPRDDNGKQTAVSLQDVLTPYGLFADLLSYAANVRWQREVGGISIDGVSVGTDDRSKQMLMGARINADADPRFRNALGWHRWSDNKPISAADYLY